MDRITIDRLKRLYTSPDFIGSFGSAKRFQMALKDQLNLKVPMRKIESMLRSIPERISMQAIKNVNQTRCYIVRGNKQLIEADVCLMPKYLEDNG